MKPWKRFPEVATLLLGLMVFTYILLSPLGIVSVEKEIGDIVGPKFKYSMVVLVLGMAAIYSMFKRVIGAVHVKAEQEEIRMADESKILQVSID